MIIDDFDILSAGIGPSETHPELVIDPDAVLSFPVTFKSLQMIPGRDAKVLQPSGDFQLSKLTPRSTVASSRKPLYRIALGQSLRIGTPEGLNHGIIITRCDNKSRVSTVVSCSLAIPLPGRKAKTAKAHLNDQSTRSPSRKMANSPAIWEIAPKCQLATPKK